MVGYFQAGAYANYRQEPYSNLAMTRKVLNAV
jgi:hypothetical protein